MHKTIRTAAVIGSGVMGSAIAAHLANAGLRCLLLDIVPDRLTAAEEAAGLPLSSPQVRNRLAASAVEKLRKTNPAPLYVPDFAARIIAGNIEDDLPKLREADWIIEAVVEKLEVKQRLLEQVEAVWRPGIIVSTNTSGISVAAMSAQCGREFREHFLGTHFFNPPRYMKLVELIPGDATNPELLREMAEFCETRLGKGVVIAKDTPNFIANRIGTFGMMATLKEMQAGGWSVEEIEAVSGPAIGRPNSATFRTLDLVGLDTFAHVADNVRANVADKEEQTMFALPEFLRTMVQNGQLGEKSGQGFFQKVKTAQGREILALNLATMTYAPRRKVSSPSLEAAKAAKGAAAKMTALLAGGDQYSTLAWNILKRTLVYAAEKLGEIADSIVAVDRAMRWGFNWELGPFETWDAIGLRRSVERMQSEGLTVPAWVLVWLADGHESFYEHRAGKTFYVQTGEFREIAERNEQISLANLKQQGKTVFANSGASLIDIGDEVACLEFHSPNNAIGADILTMISRGMEEVERNYRGMVIANEGKHFCVGANLMILLMEAQNEEWEEIDGIIRLFQHTLLKLKRFARPVVAAPHSMALGGGVEVCLPADRVCAAAETYFGLVEVGVGLIPGGGGCKETALRASELFPDPDMDLQPYLNKMFETIGMAKVSGSGYEAIRMGLLRKSDKVVINRDRQIFAAKQNVLELAKEGYVPQEPANFRVVGRDGKAVMQLGAIALRQGGFISDHDLLIAMKLAHVLAGGDVAAGATVSEEYLLELEREAFLSLCGEAKTQARMQHMLAKGKPLRN